jgi:glycosyltransferase involved in cell wall biosynthesis
VVEAFVRVRERFPSATLDLVGEHPEINLPGVTDHGYLPRESKPAQDLLDRLFASATAFVLPSLFDPSPIAYLEAASAGLPVIATTCGGAGELLQDAAISVDPYDHDALFAAMLLLADRDVAQTMGARAAARAAESTWQSVARSIADSLLCGTPGSIR